MGLWQRQADERALGERGKSSTSSSAFQPLPPLRTAQSWLGRSRAAACSRASAMTWSWRRPRMARAWSRRSASSLPSATRCRKAALAASKSSISVMVSVRPPLLGPAPTGAVAEMHPGGEAAGAAAAAAEAEAVLVAVLEGGAVLVAVLAPAAAFFLAWHNEAQGCCWAKGGGERRRGGGEARLGSSPCPAQLVLPIPPTRLSITKPSPAQPSPGTGGGLDRRPSARRSRDLDREARRLVAGAGGAQVQPVPHAQPRQHVG